MSEEDSGPTIPRLRSKISPAVKAARDKTDSLWDRIVLSFLSAYRTLRANFPELSAYGTGLFGWMSVTWAVYLVVGHVSVLWLSLGLLLLTGLGWRTVAELVWDGLYVKYLRDKQETQG